MMNKLPVDVSYLFESTGSKTFMIASDWMSLSEIKAHFQKTEPQLISFQHEHNVSEKHGKIVEDFVFVFIPRCSTVAWSETSLRNLFSLQTPLNRPYVDAVDKATEPYRSVRTNKDFGL